MQNPDNHILGHQTVLIIFYICKTLDIVQSAFRSIIMPDPCLISTQKIGASFFFFFNLFYQQQTQVQRVVMTQPPLPPPASGELGFKTWVTSF